MTDQTLPAANGTAASCEWWDLWLDTAHSPAMNMALDVALLETSQQRRRPLLRFYAWDRPSVSIGYHQDVDSAPGEEFAIVRRPTGGGVVYHDFDFTYTVVAPKTHWLNQKDRIASYAYVNDAVGAGLQQCGFEALLSDDQIHRGVDRRTMVCFKNPTRYDIVMNGRKIAGSAQRRTPAGIIHQGSIHFGAPLPVARPALAEALRKAFEKQLNLQFEMFEPDRHLLRLADELVEQQFGQPTWNHKR